MPKPKTGKGERNASQDEVAAIARERDLRDQIEQAEAKRSGRVRPSDESSNDFVERRIREKFKK